MKLTNEQIAQILKDSKGLEIPADNPNLEKIAKSLGVLPEVLHSVKVVHNVPRQGVVEAPTENSKPYLAIGGGARGRDAWFPITKGVKAHVASLMTELAEFAESLPDDEE